MSLTGRFTDFAEPGRPDGPVCRKAAKGSVVEVEESFLSLAERGNGEDAAVVGVGCPFFSASADVTGAAGTGTAGP